VTTLDYDRTQKRGFFSIYKPSQGKYVRWGTVAGAAIIIFTGAMWIGQQVFAGYGVAGQAIAVSVWVVLLGLLTFWVVNNARLAEFMIMTESEMRKVTWPSRREVINSTKVVVVLTLLLATILWLVDIAFLKLAELMKIL
jgi:preprotein translocase subunit SecE